MLSSDGLLVEYVTREEIAEIIHSSFPNLWPHARVTDLDEYLTEIGEY